MGASFNNTRGFTLVEISIVMIIIGLLIGGTFGGMKLIESSQLSKTVRDLKAMETSALSFKDAFGGLPGDLRNPAARLPNCTDAPCATGGNGDRTLDAAINFFGALAATDERFTFWHHLQASDLANFGLQNVADISFGVGAPSIEIGGGYRIAVTNFAPSSPPAGTTNPSRTVVYSQEEIAPGGVFSGAGVIQCRVVAALDRKFDDGMPYTGRLLGYRSGCPTSNSSATNPYNEASDTLTYFIYDLQGF